MSILWLMLLLIAPYDFLYASPTPNKISLSTVYYQSLKHYPSQLLSTQDIDIANNNAKMARSQWLPTIDLNVDVVQNNKEQLSYQEELLTLTQPLYNRKNYHALNGSDLSVQISQAQQTEKSKLLLIEIADVYTQTLVQQEKINLVNQSISELVILTRITKKAVELQQKPLLDLLRSEATLEEKKAELVEVEIQLEILEEKILTYMPIKYKNILWQPFNSEDFIVDKALKEHPTLTRINLEKRKELSTLEQSKSSYYPYYPIVNLSLELSNRKSYSTLLEKDISTEEAQAKISMSWNLFNGFLHQHSISNSTIGIKQKNNEYNQNFIDINNEIAKTKAILTSSKIKILSLKRALKARLLAVTTVEKSWKLNLVDIGEVEKEYSSAHEIKLNIFTEERKQDMETLRLFFLTGRLK